MTLAARLANITKGFEAQASAEALETIHRAIRELVESGAAEAALGVGAQAYFFDLPGAEGGRGRLPDLLQAGPVVLTFFRGHW